MDDDLMAKSGFVLVHFTNGNLFYLNIDNIVAIEVYEDAAKRKVRVYLTNGKLLSDIVGNDFSEDYFMKRLTVCARAKAIAFQATIAGTNKGTLDFGDLDSVFYTTNNLLR